MSQLQFGFKKKHSMTMCSLVLIETIDYYRSSRGTTFSVMLDAMTMYSIVNCLEN